MKLTPSGPQPFHCPTLTLLRVRCMPCNVATTASKDSWSGSNRISWLKQLTQYGWCLPSTWAKDYYGLSTLYSKFLLKCKQPCWSCNRIQCRIGWGFHTTKVDQNGDFTLELCMICSASSYEPLMSFVTTAMDHNACLDVSKHGIWPPGRKMIVNQEIWGWDGHQESGLSHLRVAA